MIDEYVMPAATLVQPGEQPDPPAQSERGPRPRRSSREDSRLAGDPFYYNGGFCRNGHRAARYVSDGKCSQCVAEDPADARMPVIR